MKRKNRTIDARIAAARQTIINAGSHAEIKSLLAGFNYDEERMKEGMALLEKVDELQKRNLIEKAGKIEAFEVLRKTREKAAALYGRHRKIARLVLNGDPAAVQALGLKGQISRTTGGWLEQAGRFYINALSSPGAAARLKEYGIDADMLQTGKELVDEVEQAEADAEKAKGAALLAVRERNAALKDLERWVSFLRRIARIAFKGGREQLLEALGIVVPG